MCHRVRNRRSMRIVTAALSCACAESVGLVAWADAVHPGSVVWHVDGHGRGTPTAAASSVNFLSKLHEVAAVPCRQTVPEHGLAMSGSRVAITGPLVIQRDYRQFALKRDNGACGVLFRLTGTVTGLYLVDGAHAVVVTAASPLGACTGLINMQEACGGHAPSRRSRFGPCLGR